MHTYIYYDNILLQETWGNCYIEYLYDESGSPIGINYYDGTTLNEYYFVKNIQGDVTAIRDWNGNLIATYIYDAWGNLLSLTDGTGAPITSTTHIGYINPIRYRGYYYDVETGLYYLQSRYYDAKICRFINADRRLTTGDVIGMNLFAYCGNNPSNRFDANGENWYLLQPNDSDNPLELLFEFCASMSNITYGKVAKIKSYYDPKGAIDLWNSRPFQETIPSLEMQIFANFMYEHDFVADLSVTVDLQLLDLYFKLGTSKVLSPNKNIDATYVHAGLGKSTSSILPINISYSIGFVDGVKSKENYAGPFYDIGFGAGFGYDYCWFPSGSSAICFTIGTSYGLYVGYDYYWCID